MAAQHMAKERKNAKARRKKKAQEPSVSEERVAKADGATVTSSDGSGLTKIKRFLASVMAEAKRVTWPSKPELVAGTVVVMFTLILFAGYLGVMDSVFKVILK